MLNKPTQDMINILQNIGKQKVFLERTTNDGGETTLYFNSGKYENFSFNYIIPTSEYKQISWIAVNETMGYVINSDDVLYFTTN